MVVVVVVAVIVAVAVAAVVVVIVLEAVASSLSAVVTKVEDGKGLMVDIPGRGEKAPRIHPHVRVTCPRYDSADMQNVPASWTYACT